MSVTGIYESENKIEIDIHDQSCWGHPDVDKTIEVPRQEIDKHVTSRQKCLQYLRDVDLGAEERSREIQTHRLSSGEILVFEISEDGHAIGASDYTTHGPYLLVETVEEKILRHSKKNPEQYLSVEDLLFIASREFINASLIQLEMGKKIHADFFPDSKGFRYKISPSALTELENLDKELNIKHPFYAAHYDDQGSVSFTP